MRREACLGKMQKFARDENWLEEPLKGKERKG
jgi:hypothetical protein